jgi:hypothetical protein
LIVKWMSEGKLNIPVDQEFPFSEAGLQDAWDRQMSRRARGKVIVDVGGSSDANLNTAGDANTDKSAPAEVVVVAEGEK